MSRRHFAGWGWDASDEELGQALALLGVIAPYVGARQALTEQRTKVLLRQAIKATGSQPLVWDLGQAGRLPDVLGLLSGVTARALAKVWTGRDVFGQYRRLEIRPVAWLDDRWTFATLAGQGFSLPYFGLPEPAGRLRWHWPTRLGASSDDGAELDRITRTLSPTMRNLIDIDAGPNPADVLVLHASGSEPPRVIAGKSLPDATLVMVFESHEHPVPLKALRPIAAETNARGIVTVRIQPHDEPEWLRTFLRELSHQQPVLDALRAAGGLTAVFASRSLIDAVPLRLAGDRMTATLGMTARAAPPQYELQSMALPPETRDALRIRRAEPATLDRVAEGLNQAPGLSYILEQGGATHVANVSRASEPIVVDADRRLNEDRFIRADVTLPGPDGPLRARRSFRAGTTHAVAVTIGPRDTDLIVADVRMSPEDLAAAVGHRLTVVLTEPDLLRRPLVDSFLLPPFGATEPAIFRLPVRRSTTRIRARIAIIHRGRILQTALLTGPVYRAREHALRETRDSGRDQPGIAIQAEANLRPGLAGLGDRTRFQAAIILNEDDQGRKQGTAIGRRKPAHFEFDFVEKALAGLNATLGDAEQDKAFERKLESAASIAYLTRLADAGRILYDVVGQRIEATTTSRIDRLQVLSASASTLLPLELIYDLPPPATNPRLCENAFKALQGQACEAKHHPQNALRQAEVVCPSGFWGVSKVIERHATTGDEGSGFTVHAGPSRKDDKLGPLNPVLFAASDHVNDVNPMELQDVTTALNRLTSNGLIPVPRWLDWGAQIENAPPTLLLLSHTEIAAPRGVSLEIATRGGPEWATTAQITGAFVNANDRRPGPLVLLLGCTTGLAQGEVQSFMARFADPGGASVVIGTIAPVLGRHAGRTAIELIEQMQAAKRAAPPNSGISIGEVLRDVRRGLLAKGILMAMSLAAYGDADWRLPAGPN